MMSSGEREEERSINVLAEPDCKVRLQSYYSHHQSLENYVIFSFFETENWKPGGTEQEGKSIFSFLCVVEWGGLVHIDSGL